MAFPHILITLNFDFEFEYNFDYKFQKCFDLLIILYEYWELAFLLHKYLVRCILSKYFLKMLCIINILNSIIMVYWYSSVVEISTFHAWGMGLNITNSK